VLATANVYLGLKTGWWESGGILAALVAFTALRGAGTDEEVTASTVVSQTLASSSAAMPAAIGLLGAMPALAMLGEAPPVWLLAALGVSLGVFGLVLALVFREPLLVDEGLPFPSGVAIAETVQALGRRMERGAGRAALASALVGGALTWLRDGVPAWITRSVWLPWSVGGLPAPALTLGVSVSPLLAGFGLLVGLRAGLALAAGAAVAWMALAPLLVRHGLVGAADFGALLSFLLWPGAALMVSGGMVALLSEWRAVARALAGWRRLGGMSRHLHVALVASGAAALALSWVGLGVPLAACAIVLAGSVIAALVCARAVGETGLAPMGQLGQLTQVGHGVLTSSSAAVGVAAAAIVAGAIVQTSQTMESFRVGQLLRVPPARQAGAALLGVVVGTAAALPAYLLLVSAHGLGSEALPAPSALTWKAVAEVGVRGAAAVPDGAGIAALVALALGALLELGARSRWRRVLPSPVVLGIAFVIPAESSAAIALGAIAGAVIARGRVERAPVVAAIGAGAIAGESLVGVVLAGLLIAGVLG
jgi:uncharacterized oligopeptide transporter (OPT) family protein